MNLEGGKLYNVSGMHVYGAGSTATRTIERWKDIMYVQQGGFDSFLADGEQRGGLIDKDILTKVKFPKDKFRLIGNEIITNQILTKVTICQPPGEHFDSVDMYLRKAERFAEKLPPGLKKARFLAMIRNSLYEEYEEKMVGENVLMIHKKDPVLGRLVRDAFGIPEQ